MRLFAALATAMIATSTAFASPMAMAKGASAPKAHAVHAHRKSAKKSEKKSEKKLAVRSIVKSIGKPVSKPVAKTTKREIPARGQNGRFLPRKKA